MYWMSFNVLIALSLSPRHLVVLPPFPAFPFLPCFLAFFLPPTPPAPPASSPSPRPFPPFLACAHLHSLSHSRSWLFFRVFPSAWAMTYLSRNVFSSQTDFTPPPPPRPPTLFVSGWAADCIHYRRHGHPAQRMQTTKATPCVSDLHRLHLAIPWPWSLAMRLAGPHRLPPGVSLALVPDHVARWTLVLLCSPVRHRSSGHDAWRCPRECTPVEFVTCAGTCIIFLPP